MIDEVFRMPEIIFTRAKNVLKERHRLTEKQVELLRLVCYGHSNSEMAAILTTTRQSIDSRTYKIRMKMKIPRGGHQKDKIINYVWSVAWNANETAVNRRSR